MAPPYPNSAQSNPHHRHHTHRPLDPHAHFPLSPSTADPNPNPNSMTTIVPPTVAAPPRKSTPGQPWSHLETTSLIDVYEEKWYSLKRGQLKAHQWEEVAASVAARCGFPNPSKNGTQCRHKIEKLRKRYRSERTRSSPSLWPYFDRIDHMERGPLPISIRAPLNHPPSASSSSSSDDQINDDDDEEEEERYNPNTRSINGLIRDGGWNFPPRVSRNPMLEKRRDFDEKEEEEEEGEGGRSEALSELAAVVRRFGEGLVRMEKRKMEMMRELERDWMEMEARRADMVLESQRCIMESISDAFGSVKKAKKSQDL